MEFIDLERLYLCTVRTNAYKVALTQFDTEPSKLSKEWLDHHSRMIKYKIKLRTKQTNRILPKKLEFKIISQQLLYRYWKEFRARSDSVLYKMLKRQISTQVPVILRVNHFSITKENQLMMVLSDGWYYISHHFSFDLTELDWPKLRHIFKGNIEMKIYKALTQMLSSSKKKLSDQLRKDILLMDLILQGKLSVGRKILINGFDFCDLSENAESAADKTVFEIKCRVTLNINNISPLSITEVCQSKLGVFSNALRPTELQVGYLY